MAEYIDRAKALNAISNWLRKAKHPLNASEYNRGEIDAYETAIEEISELPAADVRENVKAEWIPFTRFGEWENDGHGVFRPRLLDAGFKCSACGAMKHKKTKWCPDCGAEMVPAAVQVDWLDGGAEDG